MTQGQIMNLLQTKNWINNRKFPTKKTPNSDVFTLNYTSFKQVNNSNTSKTDEGGNTHQPIRWGQNESNHKTRQGHHKKSKLQISLINIENHQQNTTKPNPVIYKRDYTSWSNGIYSRKAKLV